MFILLFSFYDNPNPDNANVAEALRARGHTVYVGFRNPAGDLAWYDRGRLVAIVPGPDHLKHAPSSGRLITALKRRFDYWHFWRRVGLFIRQHQPDIVQLDPATTLLTGTLPLFARSRAFFIIDFRQPGLRTETGLISKLRNVTNFWGKRVLSKYLFDHACYTHTAAAEKVLGKHYARYASVVRIGVGEEFLSVQPPSLDEDTNRPVRFIYAGTISKIRQLEGILLAAKIVRASTDQFRVAFYGPDAADGYYQRLAHQYGLSEFVEFNGVVPYSEIPSVLVQHDVAIAWLPLQPPDWQYVPSLKVCEYRAVGLPIIGTDCPPNRELILDGHNGFLVENKPEAWARAMLALINDKDLLNSCRANARGSRIGTSLSEVAKGYEDVYKKIVATRGQR